MDISSKPLSAEDLIAARSLLRDAPYACLAMTDREGPYVLPLNFVFVEDAAPPEASVVPGPSATARGADAGAGRLRGAIYFHTGQGRKAAALATDPRVCLSVLAGAAFIQGDSPCADAFSYRSLLVWGRACPLEDPGARRAALRAIVTKYDPDSTAMPFDEDVFEQTLLYEVIIDAAGYKQKP